MTKPPEFVYQRGDVALRQEDFVLGAGEIIRYAPEFDLDPEKIDHFWISIRAGEVGPVQISVNTRSLKHFAEGFDPRMRVAVLPGAWTKLPPAGLVRVRGLNYTKLESEFPLVYEAMERPALEHLLSAKCRRAIFVEAWGAFYLRAGVGIHQVHSRRASCSVRTDYVGRDGAIRFSYRENSATEMLLFKYCGQV
jgi:hypothetical protein